LRYLTAEDAFIAGKFRTVARGLGRCFHLKLFKKTPGRGRKGARANASDQTRSKRSAFMTLFQAATKSLTNFSLASAWP